MQYVELRTLLRLAQGIVGDPEIRDYSVLVAACERHRAVLIGQPVFTRPVDAAAALMHTIAVLKPLVDGNEYLAWTAAYTLLGINGLAVRAEPKQALELVAEVAAGAVDEHQIAERLAGFIS